jgi:tripartite-type tricarboxylate transporter receptor subunit TctC
MHQATLVLAGLLQAWFQFGAEAALAAESGYPSKPIRIIVPTSTGGGGDLSSRLIAQRLFERTGHSVIVENRAGAGTIVGTDIVAKAPADGHTILMAPGAFATNPSTYKKMPFDTVNDFAPITQMLNIPQLIVVHPSLPAQSVKAFVALAKARPGELQYAASGHGTLPHLTMELLANMAEIRLLNVPYKGPAPGIIDLLAGRLAATVSGPSSLVAHMRAGKLRALGVTTAARIAALPDVPTIAEAGVPGYEAMQWGGLLVRAGTPRDIVTRLHKETTTILRTAEVRDRLTADGNEVVAGTPDEFGALIKAEIVKWAKVVKAAGIQPE